jgi:hypothetical protein
MLKMEEMIEHANKPDLKPYDTFTLRGPFSQNGYIVIPDELPLNYIDKVYQQLDDNPVGGLTYGGYAFNLGTELHIDCLDQRYKALPTILGEMSEEKRILYEKYKALSVRIIGFDDSHITPNELDAEDGAKYIAEQLKEMKL